MANNFSTNGNRGSKPPMPSAMPSMPPAMPVFRSVSMFERSDRAEATILRPPMGGKFHDMHHSPSSLAGSKGGVCLEAKHSKATTEEESPQFCIPLLSEFCPLSKTSQTIEDIPLKKITFRILNFLRIQSIASSCNPDDGQIDCVAANLIEFTIQLWQAQRGVVVEIQRTQGSSAEVRKLSKQLFHSVISGEAPIAEEKRSEHRNVKSPSSNQSVGSSCIESLEFGLQMLESAKLDQKRLGLESFITLTDPSNVGLRNAKMASRAIVFGEGILGERLQVAFHVFFDWATAARRVQFEEVEAEFSAVNDKPPQYATSDTHYLALVILANALQVVSTANEFDFDFDTRINLSSKFWNSIMECLVNDMNNCLEGAQEAALAAKCICLLPATDKQVIKSSVSSHGDFARVSRRALKYGTLHHASLERESRVLMDCLGYTQ